jgi:mannan endo-1,4-beta-mannosidase
VTGTKNIASTGTAVVVDRFELSGASPRAYMTRHDEKSGTFSGPWTYGANAAYIAKGYNYSRYTNATFTKTFTGTRVAWIGPKTPGYGRAKVYIDGILKGTVSQYGATGWRYKVWESASLPYGNHTMKIVPTGTKDAASKGTIIVIDAIDVR